MKTHVIHHSSPPLKTCQGLPISFRLDAKVPIMDSKVQHNLSQFLYLLTPLNSCYPLSSLLTLPQLQYFSLTFLEHAKAVLATVPLPFPLSVPVFPMYLTKLSHSLPLGPHKVYLLRMPSLTTSL